MIALSLERCFHNSLAHLKSMPYSIPMIPSILKAPRPLRNLPVQTLQCYELSDLKNLSYTLIAYSFLLIAKTLKDIPNDCLKEGKAFSQQSIPFKVNALLYSNNSQYS